MDIQNILTLAIEVIFWAMIVLMLNDFINGLFLLHPQSQYTVIYAQPPSPVVETQNIPNPVVVESEAVPQDIEKFEQIPDPWELQTDCKPKIGEPQTVVLLFPTLRLLPPAQEIQPQTKRRSKPKKSGDSVQSTANTEPRKRSKPRKKSA
ncbi:hypothetical protein PN456_09465 [Nodularia spumigena CS-586/05]|uniref:hypothetical protein n=1 Tax=Nodularia spumigena TaxID=70799 RepID=UPI00232E1058|nr:hypothetical protein [Nodularia spumigena]MDB9369184.1 hypothetical protein [Nodularia spumigena CS-586/05]